MQFEVLGWYKDILQESKDIPNYLIALIPQFDKKQWKSILVLNDTFKKITLAQSSCEKIWLEMLFSWMELWNLYMENELFHKCEKTTLFYSMSHVDMEQLFTTATML